MLASRASLARLWNQRARAWWRRIQISQCSTWPGGHDGAARGGEQPTDLRDGERNEAGIGGWGLVRADWRCRLDIGLVVEKSGSDGADGESSAGQDGVPDGARSFQHGRALLIDCSHAQNRPALRGLQTPLSCIVMPCISAARRALPLTLSITQRDAI
jgi:hypothetical protein